MSPTARRIVLALLAWSLILASCGPTVPPDAIGPPDPVPTPPDVSPTVVPVPRTPPAAERTPVPYAERPSPTPPAATPSPPPVVIRRIPQSLVGTEWITLPTDERVVALTFDAGANADAVLAIMATLAAGEIPATFFLTGRWVENHPTYTREIGRRYPVGNHSDTHPPFTGLSDAEMRAEIDRAESLIVEHSGRDPMPWFRFPYGDRDARTIRVVNDLGYGSVRWTVDTLGWKGTSGGMSEDAVVERVLAELRPGAIVLLHVGSHPTDRSTLDADTLPRLIRELRARGYGFVDLDDFLDR